MPKTKIATVRASGLNAIYNEWKKIPHQPGTPFRIAIGHSPHDSKQEGENWGALIDCIVRFAQDKKTAGELERIEVVVVAAYGSLGALTYKAARQARGEEISESDAVYASLHEGNAWKKKYFDPLLRLVKDGPLVEGVSVTFKILFWAEVGEGRLPLIDADKFPEYKKVLEDTAREFTRREMARVKKDFFEVYGGVGFTETQEFLDRASVILCNASVNYSQKEVGPLNCLPVEVVLYPEEVPIIQEARKVYVSMGLLQSQESLWVAYSVGKVEDTGGSEHNFARMFRASSVEEKGAASPIASYSLFGASQPRALLPSLKRSPSIPVAMSQEQLTTTEKVRSISLPSSPVVIVPQAELVAMREEQIRMREEQELMRQEQLKLSESIQVRLSELMRQEQLKLSESMRQEQARLADLVERLLQETQRHSIC